MTGKLYAECSKSGAVFTCLKGLFRLFTTLTVLVFVGCMDADDAVTDAAEEAPEVSLTTEGDDYAMDPHAWEDDAAGADAGETSIITEEDDYYEPPIDSAGGETSITTEEDDPKEPPADSTDE